MVGVVCVALVSIMGAWRLSFDADILNLLPQGGRAIPAFREFLARFGTLDQLYVVFTTGDGHTIDEVQRRGRRLGRTAPVGAGDHRRRRGRHRPHPRLRMARQPPAAPVSRCRAGRGAPPALMGWTDTSGLPDPRVADDPISGDYRACAPGPGRSAGIAAGDVWKCGPRIQRRTQGLRDRGRPKPRGHRAPGQAAVRLGILTSVVPTPEHNREFATRGPRRKRVAG